MFNVETDGAGAPIAGKRVYITLIANGAPGYSDGAEVSIESVGEVLTDINGRWEADLEPNTDIIPEGTVYSARLKFRGGNYDHVFTVPDSGLDNWIGDHLAELPGSLPSGALSGHLTDAVAAHAASSVAVTPSGGLTAITAQDALAELDTELIAETNARIAAIEAEETARIAGDDALVVALAGKEPSIPPGTYVPVTGSATTVTTPLRLATSGGPVAIGATAAPNYVDQLYIKGSGDGVKEPVVIDSPVGQIVDLLTCRVGGVVVFDITCTGSIELNAITFVQGVGGGNGEIKELAGGSMTITAGALSNGNIVVNAGASGQHHFQYNGTTKWFSGSTGPVYNNALTLWWKNSGGTAVEAIRGAADNTLALVSIGSGIKLWTAGFGASLVLIQDSGIWTFKDDTRLAVGSTTGLRIGNATTEKLGHYGVTPVVQPPATTDLRQALIDLGLLASGGATPLNLNGGALTAASSTVSGNLTIGTNPADAGIIRIPNAQYLTSRNAANNGNVSLIGADATGHVYIGAAAIDVTVASGLVTIAALSMSGNLTMQDTRNIVLNTATGTKIGTATTQKLGFYNATPVTQRPGVADPTGGATIDAESRTAIAALNANLEALGLQAVA